MTHRARLASAVLSVFVALCAPALAGAQMPDARRMSGIAIPTSDAPAGTVSVRLVRGELTNNVTGHRVDLRIGMRLESKTTDENGRVLFEGLGPGSTMVAIADVDGEHLESQPFDLPEGAGVRLVLVAGAGAAAGSAAPAMGGGAGPTAIAGMPPGQVVFAGQSRIQIEFDDDALEVFYMLDLVNPSPAPVAPKGELTFDLPSGAQQASTLEGASSQVTIRGRRVAITGPIAPGTTPVYLAFSLAPAGPERTLVQRLPAAWSQVQVILTRSGRAQMTSPQFANTREMTGAEGQSAIFGVGGLLAADRDLSVTLTDLPSRSRVGRWASVVLAALVLLAGAYIAMSTPAASGDASRRLALVERRDRLMADLVRVEEQYRAATLDEARYAARREELVDQLERVYGELDRQPGAGDQG
jgi:hypothetical protein